MADRKHGKKKPHRFRRRPKQGQGEPDIEGLIELRELALLRVAPIVVRPRPERVARDLERPDHRMRDGSAVCLAAHCWYCGVATTEPVQPGEPQVPTMRTREHQLPRSRGGGNDPANVVLACQGCNNRKGFRTLEEFREAEVLAGRLGAFWAEGLTPIPAAPAAPAAPVVDGYAAALAAAWGWEPRASAPAREG
ncbi:MAG: HNH endonuclease [Gemmatimonadota bacterium]